MTDPAEGVRPQPQNEIDAFDPIGLFGEKYGSHCVKTGANTRSPDSFAGDGELRFPAEANVDGDSDCSSPRLWKNNDDHNHNRSLSPPMSPNARSQAIARGRRELMEMIKNIPESCYELSLKDLVERKPPEVDQEVIESSNVDVVVEKKSDEHDPEKSEEKTEKEEQRKNKGRKSDGKKKMVGNTSIEDGDHLHKTSVFPVRLKKRASLKVAPKPPPSDGGEKHRRRRDLQASIGGGEPTSSSNNEGASAGHRRKNRFLPSFCSFCKDKGVEVTK